jgi:hypothetical protein
MQKVRAVFKFEETVVKERRNGKDIMWVAIGKDRGNLAPPKGLPSTADMLTFAVAMNKKQYEKFAKIKDDGLLSVAIEGELLKDPQALKKGVDFSLVCYNVIPGMQPKKEETKESQGEIKTETK